MSEDLGTPQSTPHTQPIPRNKVVSEDLPIQLGPHPSNSADAGDLSTQSASRIHLRRRLYSSTPATVISDITQDPCLNDGAENGVESGSEYVVEDEIEDEVEDGGAGEKDGLLENNNRPQRKSKRRYPIDVALNRRLDLLKTACPFIHKRRYINVMVEMETIVFDTNLMAFSARLPLAFVYGPVSVEALQTKRFEVCSLGKVVMVLQYITYLQLSCLVV